jgi:hypothetical protein
MKVETQKFSIACAMTAAILWILCSFLVFFLPSILMSISGHMVHMNLASMGWHLTLAGFFYGLVAWVVVATITGWILVSIYNKLLD